MSKSKKRPSSKGAGPVYDKKTGTWSESNQEAIQDMGPAPAAPEPSVLGLVAAQDAGGGAPADAAAPAKKKGNRLARMAKKVGKGVGRAKKAVQGAFSSGDDASYDADRGGYVLDDGPSAEEQARYDAFYAANPFAGPMTLAEIDAALEQKRRQAEAEARHKAEERAWRSAAEGAYATETEAAVAALGDEAVVDPHRVATLDGALTQAREQQRQATTAEARGDAGIEDPFFFEEGTMDKSVLEALERAGLSPFEITAVTLYTTQAAYGMNEVLRGLCKDPDTVRAYLPWCRHLESALAKMPGTARNITTYGHVIDPTKPPDAQIDIREVYRNDQWSPAFTSHFLQSYKVSQRIVEPGFLSTTLMRGAYKATSPVQRVIDASAGQGRSVVDLSANKKENEVLFPTGTPMRITRITDVDTGEDVPDPGKRYAADEIEAHKFEVAARIESAPAPDAQPAGASGPGSEGGEEAIEQADASLIAGVLANGPPLPGV